ncbi:MAG: DNA translocase FtsK, partial [Hyphomicrobiales bacterium]|nr:DNA translocase FtsK [Hyphomicrobiales bacterium]
LVVGAGATAVALASWSVSDPSLNHAVNGAVHNLVGYPGAVISDILMQMIGLASSVALMPPLLWGLRLLWRRKIAPLWPRVCMWIVGTLAASGFASACPTSARWPLPTGLGGVAGDAILGLFAGFSMAHGVGRLVIAAGLALVTILALTASISSNADATRNAALADDEPVTMPLRGQARTRLDEFEDADAEPGLALLSAGALAHAFLSAKGALARRLRAQAASSSERGGGLMQREPRFGGSAGGGVGLAQARGESVSRIQIHNPQSAPSEQASSHLRFAASDRPSPIDSPGGKLAAEMLTRKASLMTHARRLARGIAGSGASACGLEASQRIEPELPMAEASSLTAAQAKPTEGEERMVEMREASPKKRVANPAAPPKAGQRLAKEAQPKLFDSLSYQLPPLMLLSEPRRQLGPVMSEDALEQNARLLEGVLEDFGVRGEIMNVRPGPVVTLYELEPAPGTKSSRVISLADDVARSMSAVSARVAVVSGRNAIGIELPNQRRETVYLRELLASSDFESSKYRLPLCLGKTIGGEPVIAELARMPHLLIAGTTGSGKSVAINTMILSLLYRLKPEECRLIMVDPKMLELSVYDGIPHLLTPVVTDPKKAVVALKWAVREMEERYKRMSKLGVRNIDGYNARIYEAKQKGEVINRTVQTGFDRDTGEAVYEQEEMDLEALPFIVVIVDEMADLMMVAGKEIEGAVQRLAQMARAAGIHVILATQRPSVDVITGTIKANFPTRISFQVTSKIDSRTILGEQGAEQLLGQG